MIIVDTHLYSHVNISNVIDAISRGSYYVALQQNIQWLKVLTLIQSDDEAKTSINYLINTY